MRERRLDFLVAGAQKCGTTALHEWLCTSPQIALPKAKETHFFRDAEKFSMGASWYFSQFGRPLSYATRVGEVDPEYLYFTESYSRIAEYAESPKFIVILREPLSRARSHYRMSKRRGYESLTFPESLEAEQSRLKDGGKFSHIHHSYLGRSLYAKQLTGLKLAFPESPMLIMRFEDLFSSQSAAENGMAKICEFLDIDYTLLSIDVEKKENQASEPRSILIRDALYGTGRIKGTLARLIPARGVRAAAKRRIDAWNSRPVDTYMEFARDEEPEPLPPFALQALAQDLRQLESSFGLDIAHWPSAKDR